MANVDSPTMAPMTVWAVVRPPSTDLSHFTLRPFGSSRRKLHFEGLADDVLDFASAIGARLPPMGGPLMSGVSPSDLRSGNALNRSPSPEGNTLPPARLPLVWQLFLLARIVASCVRACKCLDVTVMPTSRDRQSFPPGGAGDEVLPHPCLDGRVAVAGSELQRR